MSTPETATLGSRAMATIAAAARIMYPHDALPDDVYARVGERLAEAGREDPGIEPAEGHSAALVAGLLDRSRLGLGQTRRVAARRMTRSTDSDLT